MLQWPAIKAVGLADGSLPFGQVPALQYGGMHLVQTEAIIRYIGAQRGLIPTYAVQVCCACVLAHTVSGTVG
jgi:hypothetical protein